MSATAARVIWIVDDSRLDLERASRVLSQDYKVETFSDGSALLERLETSNAPDVVVLDWVMPGVSGIEVCRFVRERDTNPNLAILLLTAHRHTEQIVEGLSAGANDYLAKPYEDEELRARVASLVRWRALLERAERAEAAHRKLLETAPDPLLVVDAQGRLTFVNAKAIEMLAQPAQSLRGAQLANLVPELANCHLPITPGDSVLPTSDVAIANRRFSPTINAGQDSTTVSLRDVTERRLLDERRLDFYSIIAHDLRTPLGAMTLRLANLLHGNNLDDHPAAKRDVLKLDERLRSLIAMINDFLELASLEGASYRLHRRELDLPTLLQEVIDDHQPLIDRGDLSFGGIEHAGDGRVLGDPRRLAQVFSNLVGNAVKFTRPGGTIRARIEAQPRYVEISIIDNGPGIAPSAQATLFQRYARAEHQVGGTGLGLMIVREIVEAHGGLVGVESTPGQGSRFWVRLPRK